MRLILTTHVNTDIEKISIRLQCTCCTTLYKTCTRYVIIRLYREWYTMTVRLNHQTRCSMEYFTLWYLHIGIHTAQYMFIILCKMHPVLHLTSRLNNNTLIYYVFGPWKSIYINQNLLWPFLFFYMFNLNISI